MNALFWEFWFEISGLVIFLKICKKRLVYCTVQVGLLDKKITYKIELFSNLALMEDNTDS